MIQKCVQRYLCYRLNLANFELAKTSDLLAKEKASSQELQSRLDDALQKLAQNETDQERPDSVHLAEMMLERQLLHSEAVALKKSLEEKDRESSLLRRRIQEKDLEISSLAITVDSSQQKLSKLEADLKQKDSSAAAAASTITALQGQLADLTVRFNAALLKLEEMKSKKDELAVMGNLATELEIEKVSHTYGCILQDRKCIGMAI